MLLTSFQFHKVRLKVRLHARYESANFRVSIPQGTIKSLLPIGGEVLEMNALQIANIQI